MSAKAELAAQYPDGLIPPVPLSAVNFPNDYSGLPERFTEKGVTGIVGKEKGNLWKAELRK